MSSSRLLLAIMFTDIAGYTALMSDDEQGAFALLHASRELQRPLIERYGGTWIKELGDGILATFTTVTDAVACACLIQQAVAAVPGLQLRIGIHQGEVIVEDGDVFGESVNIASRLQVLAPVGGIWISEAVYKNIANKKGVETRFVHEEELRHVREPVRVYEVWPASFEPALFEPAPTQAGPSLPSRGRAAKPLLVKLEGARPEGTAPGRRIPRRRLVAGGVVLAVLILLGIYAVPRWVMKQRALREWIPQVEALAEGSFFPDTKAFDLATAARRYVPNNERLAKLWPSIARPLTLTTTPAGASVYWKDYADTAGEWKLLGKTPLQKVWLPKGFPRLKVEKEGYIPVYSPAQPLGNARVQLALSLDKEGAYPASMVKVGPSEARMLLVGLEHYAGRLVPAFLMDRYEVTNAEYQRFVEAGGYTDRRYWVYPIYVEGKVVSWEAAMKLFRDKTGKPGPAAWEVGTYPDGKEQHPVSGVSWYEAAAYAQWAGKKLPTVYHWTQVANTWNTWNIIPRSNFNGTGTVPVGSMGGISFWGVYDIAGNVREWCFNEGSTGERFILGGAWNDASYSFNDAGDLPAGDRSTANGFRCMKELPGDTTYAQLAGPLQFSFRDYTKEQPVDDATFRFVVRQYLYDRTPFHDRVTVVGDTDICRVERIDIDAAYNGERLPLYLYLPKGAKPPYPTVLYYPGSVGFHQRQYEPFDYWAMISFILKSGRAVVLPIFKGTYERGGDLHSDLQSETALYKQHVIAWVQDVGRTLDYLQTRKDIRRDGFGFYGLSWGAAIAPIICAVDNRFKAAVLHSGGLMMESTFMEIDPLNYVSRVRIPVLMLNGRNDTFFPIETSQKQLFRLLGTAEKDKKWIVYEAGHVVPRSELMKETLAWLDRYMQ